MFALYVTGTDTGIGKTLASCALLHALRGHGLRAVGMKPVASGCERVDGEWRNADALALQTAGGAGIAYADINPFALEHPLAPELAARDAGIELALPPILDAWSRLTERTDALIVEGVGGWAAPLSATLMQADLVRALQLPVPGPVLGMLLLLLMLIWRGGPSQNLRDTGQSLLSHLSLLFIPAGVGIMVHGQRIAQEWLALMAAVLLSTALALAATALVMRACQSRHKDQ